MTNDELFPLAPEQSNLVDIKRILLRYIRYWYLFLLGATISLTVAYLYLKYYAVPQYNVYSTLLLKDDKSGQELSNADALNDLGVAKSTKNIDNEIEVIKSKSLMTRVVKELGLVTSYYIEGKIKDKEIYGNSLPIKILPGKIDSTAAGNSFIIKLKPNNSFELTDGGRTKIYKFGEEISKSYGVFTVVPAIASSNTSTKIIVRFQNIKQIADYYNHALGVQPVNKNASILLLSLTDPIPAKAKDILNKLMSVYNREAVEDKNLMTDNTLKFLNERLQYLTTDLSGVEKVVEKYKSVNGLTDISAQATEYTAQASNYNTQLSGLAIQIEVLESLENYLDKSASRYSTVPSTLGITNETLVALIGKFNELQMERERMLRTTEPDNILVQNINQQLADLRVNILENLRNIKNALQITRSNLQASSGQFQSKVKRVPAMERELLEINRQKLIKQNIYSYLLQKREETALTLAATASVARVLDPAMGGDFPISPNTQTIYLMSLLLGLGMPFAGIYFASLLNNKVQTQQDVSNITSIPILGEIAHNDAKDILAISPGTRSPISEMFRLVRTNLNYAAIGKEPLVTLITSSVSGEGKTFFSINLGASLVLTGKKVLLIDLDLRNPKISRELGLANGLGITNYLIDHDISIKNIIKSSEKIPDLFVISSGPIPPNPAELIMSSKFAHLIDELKASFDYILIDTSPVGQVADAFTISSLIDLTIYLVRYNYTQKGQLAILKNTFKNKTLSHPMIVLNDAKEINGSNYGYGYGYGYKNDNSKKKKSFY
ncbi:polysaccharide biosynthesis tyrosine autokinase [Hymenobacter sp. RP-2-7]|uniref:non-specific protein-tyrosine kinase n=1 Tax=Hymenobacter polaris TaxID=2682546 RepID=A0A7Y0AA98_9BACT|nr:tyrosine-protein kinase [Hymenobacter polaris]NML63656.1 polysaccharide biosynthesis tyrosine autokinase [Hymenobacter polaris]